MHLAWLLHAGTNGAEIVMLTKHTEPNKANLLTADLWCCIILAHGVEYRIVFDKKTMDVRLLSAARGR